MSENLKPLSNDINLTKCKVCGKIKQRIYDGKFPSGDKRWIGEDGHQWMGHTCSECNIQRSKDVMNKTRKKKKERQANG
jgi:hypothetical protein